MGDAEHVARLARCSQSMSIDLNASMHGTRPAEPPRCSRSTAQPWSCRRTPARRMVGAQLTRVRGDFALDGVIGGARPGVLRRDTGFEARGRVLLSFARRYLLPRSRRGLTCRAILIVGARRAMAGVAAHVAPGVGGAAMPAVARLIALSSPVYFFVPALLSDFRHAIVPPERCLKSILAFAIAGFAVFMTLKGEICPGRIGL
jgi:hypothetical protein